MPKGVRNTTAKKVIENNSKTDNLEKPEVSETVRVADEEKRQLQEQIEMLQKQMLEMQKGFAGMFANVPKQDNNEEREVEFVSLNDGLLNLSTDGYGQGIVYRFEEFGESQFVPLSDAKLLIKNNKSFIKDGRCYVNDEGLIKANNLTSTYKKIMDVKAFESLFTANRETFESIFANATEVQKDIFANMLIEKLTKNERVDMNIVIEVEKLTGKEIIKSAEQNKGVFKKDD